MVAASQLCWQLPAAPGVVVGERLVRRRTPGTSPGRHRRSEPAAARRESRHRPPDAGPAHRPPASAGTPPAVPRRRTPSAAPTRAGRSRPECAQDSRIESGHNQREPPGRLAVAPGPHPRHQGHGSMPASATHAVACRRMMGTPERRSRCHVDRRAGQGAHRPGRWCGCGRQASMFHAESPRFVGWVDYTIEHVFGCRERCRR